MKEKKFLCLLFFLILSMMCACSGGGGSSVYDVTGEGRTYTIDTVNQTITCQGQVHQYSIGAGGGSVEITYPDGETYHSRRIGGSGNISASAFSWSEGYETGERIPGGDLVDALYQERPGEKDSGGGNRFIAIFVIALGIWNAAAPQSAWYLSYGWRYKNAEPSDAALLLGRLGGVAAIVIGILLFFL